MPATKSRDGRRYPLKKQVKLILCMYNTLASSPVQHVARMVGTDSSGYQMEFNPGDKLKVHVIVQ